MTERAYEVRCSLDNFQYVDIRFELPGDCYAIECVTAIRWEGEA